ncbi:hypothetical protein J6O48_05980 [bacterium]|nr:hypothetical protein [bacterium]
MYINAIQPTDNKPTFQGITKLMKRQIFVDGKKDIRAVLAPRGNKNTKVGQLPPNIFSAIPNNENRPNVIKEIFTTFEECANEMREFKASINGPKEEYINRRPNSCVEKMKNIFVKHGIMDKSEKFDLEFIGGGEYKNAWKMVGLKDKTNNDELCFKVFHLVDTTPEWHKYKCHGNYAEINSSTYWMSKEGRYTDQNKFYLGDIHNGYLIDRYVDETTPAPQKYVTIYDYGSKKVDEVQNGNGHNKLYEYCIDEGGSRVVKRVKNTSNTARYVLKEIKNTPEKFRYNKWYEIHYHWRHLDKIQKEAGLALAIKHLEPAKQEIAIQTSLENRKPFVDMAIGYVLKYLPEDKADYYFDVLMKRNNPRTQTVVLNEIPLLAKKDAKIKYDDIDVPRFELDAEKVAKYYKKAEKLVLPETQEHLASYIHLLPKEIMMEEADKLIAKNDYAINDRLLHKIKFLDTEELGFSDKIELINKINVTSSDPFIKQKASQIRTKVIRDSLED